MDAFQNAADNFVESQGAQPSSQPEISQQSETSQNIQGQKDPSTDGQPLVHELEKLQKFKMDGKEWTLQELKSAILRQQDYTKKTQSLAKEREAFQENQKYYENLAWDLMKVRQNPSLAQEFVRIYPQSFHKYLQEAMANNQGNQGAAQPTSNQGVQGQDIQLLSRLDKLEKFYHAQEVKANEAQIDQVMNDLSKKYPDASNFKEMVLGRAFEAHEQGVELTPEAWEDIFKQVDGEVGSLLKSKYGNLVKQQTEANKKASDVGSGGGTPGAAPKKFKKFDEITKHALSQLG